MRRAGLYLLPELVLVLLGALLRLTFWDNYGDASRNFDFIDHKLYIEWFGEHWTLPPIDLSRSTYGPPLFYLISGIGLRLGGTLAFPHFLAMGLGLLRLAFFAWALRWVLPHERGARLVALGLAAVLPSAVHLDGMTNNESLSMMLCWLLLGAWKKLHEAEGASRWRWAVGAGVLLGAALLTKYSAVILAVTMAGIALVPWVLEGRRPTPEKRRASAPWVVALLVAASISGWFFVRNRIEYGQLFPTAFEGGDRNVMTEEIRSKPLFQRREWHYFVRWSPKIHVVPHYPSESSSFLPVLTASTFSAYYLVNFSPQLPKADPETNARLPEPTLSLARASVTGGTLLGLALVIGVFAALVAALRRRDALALGYVVAPILAVLGQAYFSLKYPIDHYGVTKGGYLQFAAPPMFVIAGLVVSYCWHHRRLKPLAVLQVLALLSVAAYSIQARLTAL